MAGHGGRRAGAGRPAGSPNRATKAARATFAELAQGHSDAALETLVEIMGDTGATAAARIAAATAILDRGYGRPRQAQEISGPEGAPIAEVRRVIVDPQEPMPRELVDAINKIEAKLVRIREREEAAEVRN